MRGGFDSQKYAALSVSYVTLSGRNIISNINLNSHLPIYTQFIHYFHLIGKAAKK